jgi:hypothetical protein
LSSMEWVSWCPPLPLCFIYIYIYISLFQFIFHSSMLGLPTMLLKLAFTSPVCAS